ncbi:MAG: hypothetical protein ACTSYI_02560 [Promethearchaeota archaeon]
MMIEFQLEIHSIAAIKANFGSRGILEFTFRAFDYRIRRISIFKSYQLLDFNIEIFRFNFFDFFLGISEPFFYCLGIEKAREQKQ